MSQSVKPSRREQLESVLAQRTRYITVVLEDIYQTHNASGVLRNCDSFGIQDIHIIENKNPFKLHKGVSCGAEKWLTLYRYNKCDRNNTEGCLQKLRRDGYRLVATTPHTQETAIEQLPLNQKLALMFGTELTGLSDYAEQQADLFTTIPMVGFSESLNITVSVALCLYELTKRLRKATKDWSLSEEEIEELRLDWLHKAARSSESLPR
jgi:tRNA (guanosine-2'-O-)-methyltransferase